MISIITPFYNSEAWLERCIQSALGQTYTDFELLLINDGSQDNSVTIAQQYAATDPRIRLFNKEHEGFPAAKNFGLDNAQGEYIAFLDSDDFVHEEWLETLYNAIEQTGADISATSFYSFRDINDIKEDNNGDYETIILKDNKQLSLLCRPVCSYMWNKLYKRELFDNIRFPDVVAMSDVATCPYLVQKANYITFTNRPVYYYYVHRDSMCHSAAEKYGPIYWDLRAEFYSNLVWLIHEENSDLDIARQCTRLYYILENCSEHIDITKYREQFKDWYPLWEELDNTRQSEGEA